MVRIKQLEAANENPLSDIVAFNSLMINEYFRWSPLYQQKRTG